jgi:hypothetical protein
MIISYVWVLETNTGATWRVSSLRIVRIDPVLVPLSPIYCLGWNIIGGLVWVHREWCQFFLPDFPTPTIILCFLDRVDMPHEPIWSCGDGDGSCESSNFTGTFLK